MAKHRLRPQILKWSLALALIPAVTLPRAESPDHKQDVEILKRTSQAFNEVAKSATPAVVSISIVKTPSTQHSLFGGFGDFGLPFGAPHPSEPGEPGEEDSEDHEMPPDGPPNAPDEASPSSFGIGSGVLIRPDGMLVTSYHVVKDAEKMTVHLDEKRKQSARIVGVDPGTDVAVLQLEGDTSGLPTLSFGDSDAVRVGDWAIAIGNPFGLNHSVTSGIISAKGRGNLGHAEFGGDESQLVDMNDLIQTDAPINPGNSGGPLLNLKGEMIGLNAAIFSQSGGFIGIGFAIPSKIVKQVTEEILAHGRVIRGWIGVSAQDMDPGLSKFFRSPEGNKGALVADVLPNSPADKSKIQVGDVILRYDNQPVSDAANLKTLVSRTRAGKTVRTDIIRSGKTKSLSMAVREQPQPRPLPLQQQAGKAAALGEKEKKPPNFGLSLQDVPEEFWKLLHLPKQPGALIVAVRPGSAAFDAGLSPGDIILRANDLKISSVKDFQKFVSRLPSEDSPVLYVQRGPDSRIFVSLARES